MRSTVRDMTEHGYSLAPLSIDDCEWELYAVNFDASAHGTGLADEGTRSLPEGSGIREARMVRRAPRG